MNREKWTLHEKKKLIRLLSKYDLEDYQGIAKRLPNKTADEVKTLILTQLRRAEQREKVLEKTEVTVETHEKVDDVPAIDKWLKITHGLVNRESLDFSTHLARVMSIIADFETFPSPDPEACKPDYRAIYRYLGALLAGQEVPELEPLESAVVLEVLHSLLDVLGGADIVVQRNIMKWKYQLIAAPKVDSKERMKYNKKVIENDFTDFVTHQEEAIELSDSDSDIEMTDGMPQPAEINTEANNDGEEATLKRRGRPRKYSAQIFCDAANNLGMTQKLRENTSDNSITTGDRRSLDSYSKVAREVSNRVPNESGRWVHVKFEKGEDLVNKEELDGLQQKYSHVVRRREYTYRPPARGPEVVLVMPPVNKPIIKTDVRDRNFKISKDGKYRSLGKATDNMVIHNPSTETNAAAFTQKDAVNASSEATVEPEAADKTKSSQDSLSHEEIVNKLNASCHKKCTLKEVQDGNNYKYKHKTALKQYGGSISVKLPVKNAEGNIGVKFPVANIGSSGTIHVQLSAANVENTDTLEEINEVEIAAEPPVLTKHYNQETAQSSEEPPTLTAELGHPYLQKPIAFGTEMAVRAPQSLSLSSIISRAAAFRPDKASKEVNGGETYDVAWPTEQKRPESVTKPKPKKTQMKGQLLSAPATAQTLEKLAVHVKSKSLASAISEPKGIAEKPVPSISILPGPPVKIGNKRVVVIRKPVGTPLPPELVKRMVPVSGPGGSSKMILREPAAVSEGPHTVPPCSTGPVAVSSSKDVSSTEASASQIITVGRDTVVVRSASANRPQVPKSDVTISVLSSAMPTPKLSTAVSSPKPSTGMPTPKPSTALATSEPSTVVSTPEPSKAMPTSKPSTAVSTPEPSTCLPTQEPSIVVPTSKPSKAVPTSEPNTETPTPELIKIVPTPEASTAIPTPGPSNTMLTPGPSSAMPSPEPSTSVPTPEPSVDRLGPGPSTAMPTSGPAMPASGTDLGPERSAEASVSAGSSSEIQTQPVRVHTGSEFPVIPFSQLRQRVSNTVVEISAPSGSSKNSDRPRKRKVFDKSRYTAFVKETGVTEKAPKKPKLYSLNPFCVPISLLDIGK